MIATDQELAIKTLYIPLEDKGVDELKEMAKKLGLKLPPALNDSAKIAQAIRIRQTRLQLDAESAAIDERKREMMSAGRKPSFEEVLMYGGEFLGKKYEPSTKGLYRFMNNLDPGQDVAFTKGGVYFHVFEKDKNRNQMTMVMPDVFCQKVDEPPSHGATYVEKLEYELFKAISLVEEGVPIHKNRPDPQTGAMMSKIVGFEQRFDFIRIGDAPKDASFGPYFKGEMK